MTTTTPAPRYAKEGRPRLGMIAATVAIAGIAGIASIGHKPDKPAPTAPTIVTVYVPPTVHISDAADEACLAAAVQGGHSAYVAKIMCGIEP